MGFDLSRNFAYPYFSSNIQEFWRLWHMSLTGWFREYVYQPLRGSQTSTWRWVRDVMLVFLLSGLWHGAFGSL
jgi:alginate O-acetyltransferase complex protein AlgI